MKKKFSYCVMTMNLIFMQIIWTGTHNLYASNSPASGIRNLSLGDNEKSEELNQIDQYQNEDKPQEYLSSKPLSKKEIVDLKTKIQLSEQKIKLLKKNYIEAEREAQHQDKKIREIEQKRKVIEKNYEDYRKNVELEKSEVDKKLSFVQKRISLVLINKLNKIDEFQSMMNKKILLASLKNDLSFLNGLKNNYQQLLLNHDELKSQLDQMYQAEQVVKSELQDLQGRKNEILEFKTQEELAISAMEKKFNEESNRQSILKHDLKQRKLSESYKKIQTSEIPNSEPGNSENSNLVFEQPKNETEMVSFLSPIKAYQKIQYNQKGVTYFLENQVQVLAPQSGSVIHVGPLASYGNVIMIEHGNQTRSVLLGHMEVKVKKGDNVQKNTVVAFSSQGIGETNQLGQIYFEVRRNNLAQNTFPLIDKKTLAKNFLK